MLFISHDNDRRDLTADWFRAAMTAWAIIKYYENLLCLISWENKEIKNMRRQGDYAPC